MSGTHAAVVLAAGGSRRLGRAKQLLTRGGETLAHRAARLCAETSPRRLLVVVGAYREDVAQAVAGIGCELVVNDEWERGLGSSLRTAAAALVAHEGPTLIVACDQPALESAHLRRLLDGAAATGLGCAATLHDGAPGIPAVLPPSWREHAGQLQGDQGMGRKLRELRADAVWTLDAPELGFDIDNDADLRVAIERGLLDDVSL
ncbi:nucleotidyltransferase family protein [Luteimonas sp. SX5]|uniref:Nucleotidyltransferase family protein n=1 Tax=Luteimonas galliterrae TaxID=2940486 RepID=A0ABT0MIZ8_9GAMM|nr:nucleotidyltransferase family protein [Luteimonas galliterrae]MCL1634844.1 nucleotidyltransferase family protein [Luteimonas galliterrae]